MEYLAEQKICIILDGLRCEDSIAEVCRKEGIADLLLGQEVTPVAPDHLLRTLQSLLVSLPHRVHPWHYDEPQTLP